MLTIKKSTALLAVLLFMAMTTLLVVSCNDNQRDTGRGVFVPVIRDTSALSKIDHFIPVGDIKKFRLAFNRVRDSLARKQPDLFITESEGFNKPALLQILKDSACVGIRIYYGVLDNDKKKELRMIIVGTDSRGKDLFIERGSPLATRVTGNDGGLEYGQCCQGSEIAN